MTDKPVCQNLSERCDREKIEALYLELVKAIDAFASDGFDVTETETIIAFAKAEGYFRHPYGEPSNETK